MNRVDRLVAIILLLQSKKILRGQEIASHFNISLRTVYRDISALCEAGVPVAAEAGEGYSLVEGYHLPPVMFSVDEASALFTGAKFVEQMTDSSLSKHAQSALLKIRSVLPERTRDYLENLKKSTAVYSPNRPKTAFRDDILTLIQEAVVHNYVINMEYYTQFRDTFTQRYVEPMALIYYADHWHMIAWCRLRKDYRDFRTDRIKNIQKLELSFARKKDFSLKNYLEQFEQIESTQEVILRFPRKVAALVKDRYIYGLINEQESEDGTVFTLLAAELKWLVPWLMSHGTNVEVIEPFELKQLLAEEALKINQHHSLTAEIANKEIV